MLGLAYETEERRAKLAGMPLPTAPPLARAKPRPSAIRAGVMSSARACPRTPKAAAGPLNGGEAAPAARPPGRCCLGQIIHQRHRRGSGPVRAVQCCIFSSAQAGLEPRHAQPAQMIH